MPKEDSASTKKNSMSLQKAIRRDWLSSHKGAIIGTTVCVAAAAGAIALAITRPWVSEAHVLEQTAAIVDGDTITEGDVADYVDKYRRYIGKTSDTDWASFLDENSMTAETVRSKALDRLEQQLIISKAAKEGNITATAEEIDEKIAAQREKAGLTDDDAEWNSWLSDMGYTEATYRDEIEYGIIEDKYVATQITPVEPSDYSLQSQASSNVSSYTGRKAYRILFKVDTNATAAAVSEAQEKAEAVLEELGDDVPQEDFIKKATELAKDKNVVAGDMGWDCVSGAYEVMVQKELDTLGAGELSDEVVRDGDGFNIIFCTATYLPDDDGNIDISVMPEEIAKVLREDTYEAANKNPKNTYLMLLNYNHSIDTKDMPEGLPYDVDMSLSTYHADDGIEDTDSYDDGTIDIDAADDTIVSDDGSTIVTTEVTDGEDADAADDEAEGTTEGDDADADDSESEDEEKTPAVEPSSPTTVQTFGDSADEDEDEE